MSTMQMTDRVSRFTGKEPDSESGNDYFGADLGGQVAEKP